MQEFTIIISIIALIVSISSFQWNKAQHNLNQLQETAKKFCDNLQAFIELGSNHCLTSHKYKIENLYLTKDKEKRDVSFNNLQLEFSKRQDNCQQKYKILMESIAFFQIQGVFEDNELLKFLNKTINDYYLKLYQFYGDLFDINAIVKVGYKDLITKENLEFVNSFFVNIRDLLDYNAAFSLFKKEVSGYFSRLSLADVGLFGNTKQALKGIERDIMKTIKEFGLEEAINEKEYEKIRKFCPDFSIISNDFVEEEKSDFLKFLYVVKDMKS